MTNLSRILLSVQLAFDAVLRFVAAALWWIMVAALGTGALVATSSHSFAAKRHHHTHVDRAHDRAAPVITQIPDDRYPFLFATPAQKAMEGQATRRSRAQHSPQQRERREVSHPSSYIKVTTAPGIVITAAPKFASQAAGVIEDLVAAGYRPKKLGSLSFAKSHVVGSLHHRAEAIDVDQCGWGCTPAPKQTLRMIVAKHGLRDGCEFRDAGHFDDGPHLPYKRVLRNCGRAYADAVEPARQRQRLAGAEAPDTREAPFYAATADFKSHNKFARRTLN